MQQRAPKSSVKQTAASKKQVGKGQKKTFVLDTNVLLHDPRAMFSFRASMDWAELTDASPFVSSPCATLDGA